MIEIKVTIDTAPALTGLIERIAKALDLGADIGEQTPAPAATPKEAAPATATKEAEPEEAPEPSYPTDDELKQAMDITISKFAGTGWRDAKDSRSQAIRKGCSKAFKQISQWLGSEKPTALEGDKRNEFLKRLEEIFIEEEEGKDPSITFRPY